MTTEILTTVDCARCDQHAVAKGVSSQMLMLRAGQAVADAIRQRWAPRPVCVLAGPGHNGGDGLIAAAELREAGWPVEVFALASDTAWRGDAVWARSVWNAPVQDVATLELPPQALVMDALFGAGLSRPLTGMAADLCARVASAGDCVVAIDLPSGLPGDGQAVDGPAFKADLTVTFHRRKSAHLLDPCAQICGEVVLADIGIPDSWSTEIAPLALESRCPDWAPAGPDHDAARHKHQRGRVAVFSGGPGQSGAARLAARAALRAGAGLVTLCSPPNALQVNAAHLDAVMLARWTGEGDTADVLAALRAQAAVLGPAMGVGERSRAVVLEALGSRVPLVLDADALTSFEGATDTLLTALHADVVLTPHAGEFARLFGVLAGEGSQLDRARRAADRASCTVVLKGPSTVIAAPGAVPFINIHAAPWLATAGSGDVLAGMIASGLAAGMPSQSAAAGAVWLHGDAGRRLGPGLIAEDLPEILPRVLDAAIRARRRAAAFSHLLAHGSQPFAGLG